MMLGHSNKRIALQLNVAVGTVKTHVKSVLNKLDAASRTEAVAIAQRRGILHEESEFLSSEPGVLRRRAARSTVQASRPVARNGRGWAVTDGNSNATVSSEGAA
jgi:hypothetical protein